MRRSLSLLAIAVGSGLLVASAFAEPQRRSPKILRVSLAGTDFDYTDPALAYFRPTWIVEYATCLKLMNYPDAPAPEGVRLVPEASLAPRVSRNGRRYTFAIRRGLRFNTGERVTPESFAKALYRVLSPRINSPGFSFVSEVAGASAVFANQTRGARGIHVRGRSLIIDLVRPVPDFLQRMALPFFCATATSVGTREAGVEVLPSGGPYYIAARRANRSLVLRRNPYYRGSRPHRVAAIVYATQQRPQQSLRDIETGRMDWAAGELPVASYAELGRKYGLNRSRFWVNSTMSVRTIVLDSRSEPFSDPQVRNALNYTVDRRAFARARGAFDATPTDDYLPPPLRGKGDPKLYPLRLSAASVAKARRMVEGRLGSGVVTMPRVQTTLGRLTREALERLGLVVREAPTYCRPGGCGGRVQVVASGASALYPDAATFLGDLLASQATDDRTATRLSRLARLHGRARTIASRTLSIELDRTLSPVIAHSIPNDRDFFSARVGCVTFQPVYGIDLAALCLR